MQDKTLTAPAVTGLGTVDTEDKEHNINIDIDAAKILFLFVSSSNNPLL
jgi:hypothetical protein